MQYTILFLAFFACNFSQRTTPSATSTDAAAPGMEAKTDSIVPPAFDANNRLIRVTKTDADWKKELDELEYNVLRQEGTERAFTGDLVKNKQKGTYTCRGCGLPLFSSDTKFESGTGWPSYWKPLKPEYVTENQDRAYGMLRTEVECARCGGHLGHVFDDGPKPTGLRYCINSVSLDFVPE